MEILIIEDDPRIRDILKELLDLDSDYNITVCPDGVTGTNEILKKWITKCNFDCVITDLRMPQKNGLEVIDFLRKSEVNGEKVSVIVVSAYLDKKTSESLLEYDEVFLINKPFNHSQVLAILREINSKK